MRQSRQSSVLSANEKARYPRCDRKKEHNKESLNFVCLTPNCKSRGLICVQCKGANQHSGHQVQPLRSFLNKLEEKLKKIELQKEPKMEESVLGGSERLLLEKLGEQHLQMLYLLQIQVSDIAQKVRACEQEVLREYERLREKISTQFQKQTIVSRTLAQIQSFFAEFEKQSGIDLKLSVAKLLSLVKVDKNEYSILNQAEKDVNAHGLMTKTFKNNLLAWERETNNILSEVFKSKPEYQVKQGPQRPTTALDSKPSPLTFSAQLKTESISLDKDLKTAKVKDDKNGKIVLLNHSVLEHKDNSIRFKVTGQMGSSLIQFGLCLKSIVQQKQFKFDKTSPGHGLFVVSSNSFLYSSGDAALNNSKGAFSFKSGDEVTVEVDAKQNKMLVHKKNFPKPAEVSLKHVAEADWKDLFFCVSLTSVGDKVQLLS